MESRPCDFITHFPLLKAFLTKEKGNRGDIFVSLLAMRSVSFAKSPESKSGLFVKVLVYSSDLY